MSSSTTDAAQALVAVTMPDPGPNVDQAKLVAWCVTSGELVEEGEPICVVSVDGDHAEVLSASAGRVASRLLGVGAQVGAGTTLAELEPIEAGPEEQEPEEPEPAEAEPEESEAGGPEPEPTLVTFGWLYAPNDTNVVAEEAEPSTNGHEPAWAADVRAWINDLRVTVELDPEANPEPKLEATGPVPAEIVESSPDPAPEPEPDPEPEPEAPPESRPTPPPLEMARFHSPAVRQLAAEHDVDLAEIVGTGREGRIRKEDVLAALAALEDA